MRNRKTTVFGAVAVVAALVLTGCASSTPEESEGKATTKAEDLVIYTARAEPISDYVIEAFVEEYPEYEGKVEVLSLGAAAILERVRAEGANPQASLWWGGTQQGLSLGAEEGFLAEWSDASFADQIDPMYKDEDGRWFAEYLLPQVIIYNSDALEEKEAPQDWDDLLEPEWADKIVIRNVAPSGGMRSVFDAVILNESPDGSDPEPGYDWLRKLDANTVTYAADPSDLYLQLSRQAGTVSIWNLQDTLIQIEQNNMPFGYVVPESGSPVLVDGLGVVTNAPNPEGAKLFAEFLYDTDLRATLAEDYFQIPVTEIEGEPEWLADLDLKTMEVDWAVASSNETAWIEYWSNNIKNKG